MVPLNIIKHSTIFSLILTALSQIDQDDLALKTH